MGFVGWLLAGIGFILVAAGYVTANGGNNPIGEFEGGFIMVGIGFILIGMDRLMGALAERAKP